MGRTWKIVIPLVALPLTACASSPDLRVTSSGTLPQNGTYRIAPIEQAAHLEELVSERLDGLGFSKSEEPGYLVQVGAFERPAGVGLFVPDVDERQWLRNPSIKSRRMVQGVVVSLTEMHSGREIYRVTAAEKRRKRAAPDGLASLVAAAFTPPSDPHPTESP